MALKKRKIIILLSIIVALSSCSKYQKLLKSDDVELKYKTAVAYYESKDYTRAEDLFSDVIPRMKGTDKTEEAYYMRSMCYMMQKDYVTAGHYFGTFIKRFPNSSKCEDAQFNKAYCLYKQSPNVRLDQATTKEAIQEFQLFANIYTQSSKKEEVDKYIDELKDKLVEKSYLNAKLYFDLGDYTGNQGSHRDGNNYKAAVITAQNSLKEFPETKYREELSFLIVKAKYEQAIKSIPAKMEDRYTQTVDEYYSFNNEFPNSKYSKEVKNMFDNSMKYLDTLKEKHKTNSVVKEGEKEIKKEERSNKKAIQ